MYPFIRNNDVITLSSISRMNPRFGEVVAFISPSTERLAIHRVIGKRGTFIITKGDNLDRIDGLVPRYNILGRVSKIERNGKKVRLCIGLERYIITLLIRSGLISALLRIWIMVVRFLATDSDSTRNK